jgi:predicted transcriptional regulator
MSAEKDKEENVAQKIVARLPADNGKVDEVLQRIDKLEAKFSELIEALIQVGIIKRVKE